jgi:hypothetical protein
MTSRPVAFHTPWRAQTWPSTRWVVGGPPGVYGIREVLGL